MPKIISVGRALPPYKLTQHDIREFVRIHFSHAKLPIDRLLEVFENAQINERYFSVPMEWYTTNTALSTRMSSTFAPATVSALLRSTMPAQPTEPDGLSKSTTSSSFPPPAWQHHRSMRD